MQLTPGSRWKSAVCDTEVVVAAWETWGLDALARLSGMWACVVWDAPRLRATAAPADWTEWCRPPWSPSQ